MALSGTRPLTDGFDALHAWTGRWRWNARTAVFANPVHSHVWESQVQDIIVEPNRFVIRNDLVFQDGSRRRWTLDSALDGLPRAITWDDDGSVMAVIGFFQLGPLMGGDAYFTPDNSFTGSEYFILGGDNLKVWGSSTTDGNQYTYFEEWDRIG
jgi:hypothetical protein